MDFEDTYYTWFTEFAGSTEVAGEKRAYFYTGSVPFLSALDDSEGLIFGTPAEIGFSISETLRLTSKVDVEFRFKKLTKAPEWIMKYARDWYKKEAGACYWIVKEMNVPYLWYFQKYLTDHIDGLKLFDENGNEIDKDDYSDENDY